MFWTRDPDIPVNEPTREELNAFKSFLRDRESFLRRTRGRDPKQTRFDEEWAETELLESLSAKLWRRFLGRVS